jgi:group I intron endonuclease
MSKLVHKAGVYSIYCTANEKQYIGKSKHIAQRWRKHRSKLRNKKHVCRHLQNAWNKHGEATFVFNVIENVIDPLFSDKQLTDIEQIWIDAYWDTGTLFNSRRLAESNVGMRRTEDTKRKMSESHKGIPLSRSEETKRKLSERNKGKPWSEARRKAYEARREENT